MRESLRSTSGRFVDGIGAGAVERCARVRLNWTFVLRLFPMLIVSFRYPPRGRWLAWWRYLLGQLGKEVGRSLVPIIALGMGFGLGIGSVTGGPGTIVAEVLATQDALPTVLRVAVPLALTVFFAARTGGPLAAKFALAVRESGGRWTPRELARDVSPHLLVAVVMGVLAYTLTAEFLVRGYDAAGELSTFWTLDGVKLIGWGEYAVPGMGATILLSYAVSHIAIAYGAAQGTLAAEAVRSGRAQPDHYVIWQSFRASVMLAFLFTLLLT